MTGMGSSCGACKFLRRRCTIECVYAPYFGYEQAASHFEAVHRVFGASNVSKLLLNLPVQNRAEAAITISYEALARMQDPIYGCVAHIFALEQQVACLKEEIEMIETQMASLAVDVTSSCESYNVADYSNPEIAFGCDQYMNLENFINQQQMELDPITYTEVKACDDSQMMVQFPPGNGWEDAISQLSSSNSNLSEPLIQEFTQTIYEQCLWPEYCSTLN
ncbi:LOB domain-containing protein 33-like [Coffea arabica]|uniref:LOB domain-containing protein 33-like n=1 Tax=Coffea arabica TaxID=13443 RepID=A0A6P6W5Z5_COFAR